MQCRAHMTSEAADAPCRERLGGNDYVVLFCSVLQWPESDGIPGTAGAVRY